MTVWSNEGAVRFTAFAARPFASGYPVVALSDRVTSTLESLTFGEHQRP
jgi:hypothetical protein